MTLMSRLLAEAELHVDAEKWEMAEVRLRDIAERVLELPDTGPNWPDFAARIQGMAVSFERVRKNEIQFKGFRNKWRTLVVELRAKLSEYTGPFPATKGGAKR